MCETVFHVALNHKTTGIAFGSLGYGNIFFIKKKNYIAALIFYNQLINHSKKRKHSSLGYACRSAVYYELGLFDECLRNIELARENLYPEYIYPQLNEREEKCHKGILRSSEEKCDPWEIFKLSYPPNKQVPFVANCVEVKITEKYGRGIYATRDLNPGDIICIEDIVANFGETNYEYLHCFNCYKTNALNLFPCDLTGHMMFCSVACRNDVYSKAININSVVSADIKILSDIVDVFGTVGKFNDFILDTYPDELTKTIFDYDFSNPEDPDYKNNLMICFLSLTTNEHHEYGHCSDIFNYLCDEAAQRILSIFNLNRKKSYVFVNRNEYLEVGCHISLFASLINHSCLNNAFTVLVDNKIATVIQHPVKAGEQIFFNYLSDTMTKNNLESIEELHMFKCDCNLCLERRDIPEMSLRKRIGSLILESKMDVLPLFLLSNHDEFKKYLEEKWKACKNFPVEFMYYFEEPLYPQLILDYVAGRAAFPLY